MKNATQDITLYNYYLDPATGYDTCQRLYMQGVSVFAQTKVEVSKDGLAAADVYTLRIHEAVPTARYVTPKQFQALEDKTGYFTLSEADKIVLGCAKEETPTPAQLESAYGNGTVLTITGVTDDRGKRAPHWKVTGK